MLDEQKTDDVILLEGDAPQEQSLPEDHQEHDELAELRRQLEAERAARLQERNEAEALRQQNANGAARIQAETLTRLNAQDGALDQHIAAGTIALNAAKQSWARAMEEGRFADAATHNEEIAAARDAINAAAAHKNQISAARQQAAVQQMQAPQAPRQALPPAEQMLASIQSTASRQWLMEHRDVLDRMATDPRYLAKVEAADKEAFGEGIDRDTPEYFDFIEGKLGLNAPRKGAASASAVSPSSRRPTASASRSVRIDDIVGRLTPRMREAARHSAPRDMPEMDALRMYARGLVKAKQSDPSFLPDFVL